MRQLRRGTNRIHDQAGFTLPELLIVIAIMGLITSVLGSALIVNFRTATTTDNRLGATSDTQIASAYFSSDTASTWRTIGGTNYITYGPPNGSATASCADPTGAATQLSLGYSWIDSSYQGTAVSKVTKTADWVTEGSGTSLTLVRLFCATGTPAVTRMVMASKLASAPAVVGDLGTVAPKPGNCITAVTCSLQVTVVSADPQYPAGAGPTYQFTLTGTPRINAPPPGGSTTPIPPLLVLCTAKCIPASDTCIDSFCQAPAPPVVANSPVSLDINDTSSLYVLNPDGTPASNIVVNSPGPVAATAVEGSRVGYLDAGNVFHTVPIVTPNSTATTCYMDSASTGLLNCPTGGTGTPQADPFSGLASPSTAGLTTYPTQSAGCTVSAATGVTTCQPGVYSAPLIISGNALGAPAWQGNHAYAAGTIILPTGTNNTHFYKAAAAGTSSGGQPAWPDNTNPVNDNGVTWTDIGVPTTNMVTGVYVLNAGMQLGRTGQQDNIVLTTDINGVLLNFNGDGQLTENVKWATVTLNPLTTTSCAQWCDFAGISIFAPILPKCVSPNTVGCWTYNNAVPPAPIPHLLDMFVSGAIYTQGIVDAPGDSVTTDSGGDNSNAHFTQIAALIVSSLHIGWPNAILQVGGGPALAPIINTIAPTFLGQGATNQTITVTGINLDQGAAITLANPGIGFTGPTNWLGGVLSVGINVSGTAAPGATNLTVTNPNGSNFTAPGGFTVLAAPTITSLSPNHLGVGATNQTITINGTNFVDPAVYAPGVTASFAGAGIVVSSITRLSSTQLTAVVSVPAGAAVGASDVTVDNQDKGTTATLTGGFTVVGVPTITSIMPNALGQGQTNQNTTVNGTNFINGATLPPGSTVRFANAGVQVNSVTYVSPTQLTVNVTVSASAVPGAGNVTVDNRDAGTTVTLPNGFTVLASPTVTAVSPTAGPVGGATPVTITGTNFTGATQVLFGAAPVAAFTVVSPTQITTTSPTTILGATTVDVTVTTPANTSAVTRPADQFTYGGPSVTSVAPNGGPIGGGTSVVITGTGFTINSTVTFGGMPAAAITLNSSTQITATPAAHVAATVEVVVTTPAGVSPPNPPADQFTYENPPTVTSVSPTAGPTAGNTTVTITGTNLFGASAASFGGIPGINLVVNGTGTQITVASPAHAAGTVDVTVTTPGGTSVLNPVGDLFAFGVPTVTLLSPNGGPPAGGTPVTITGTGFTAGSTVTFGGFPVAATVVSGTQITTTSATVGSTGVVDVLVTTPVGVSAPTVVDHFTYEGTPTVTSVSPTAGAAGGGTTVTITGTNFYGASVAGFGATPGSNVVVNGAGTVITVTSPTGTTGTVDVRVTTPVGQSALNQPGDEYTFGAPTVTAVTPSAGPIGGGTTVTISGTGFTTDATVRFGGSPGGTVTFVSPTSITVVTPAHAAATVDLTVTTPVGASALNAPADQFTFGPPTVTLVSPNVGPVGGGTPVTITGTGFTAGSTVTFGGLAAGAVTVVNSTRLTVTSPAVGSGGVVDVLVTSSAGVSAPTVVDNFTYDGTPTVTAVNPKAGTVNGGTTVTITGTGFLTATGVTFGATPGTIVTILSDTTLTAVTPNHPVPGQIDITVTNTTAASATSPADLYTYDGAPTVTAVSPAVGTVNGGTTVTITGTGFLTATGVNFGATAGTGVTILSDTSLTVTSPAHAAGLVQVTVGNTTGTSAVVAADQFTFAGAPTVTGVNPTAGTTLGGTTVTITGTNFIGVSQVMFGASAATAFTVNSATQITATAPVRPAGAVDVTVTTPIGISAPNPVDVYTYEGTPTVTSVSPTAGPAGGGTTVTITGTNFYGASVAGFGANPGTNLVVNGAGTVITVTSPTGTTGTVDVRVTTPVGQSPLNQPADEYTFGAPTVTAVTPSAGPIGGATTVTITGTGFTTNATVSFGGSPGGPITFVSPTSITVVTLAHAAATVDLTVTNPAGPSAINAPADQFTFGPPTVTSVNPNFGPMGGGTPVTITGTGFTVGSTVTFGGLAAGAVTVVNSTQITVTSPAVGSGGVVDVLVTSSAGVSPATFFDNFTYDGAPTVTVVSPVVGTINGGTTVTVTGKGFLTATGVTFGATAGTGVTILSDTSLTVVSPAHAAGQIDITVTNTTATSTPVAADKYTYDGAPTVTAVSPAVGTINGGTTVTVTGTGFLTATGVKFGATAGTGVTIISDTSLTVVSPAHAAGQIDITVTNTTAASTPVAADKYTYDGIPTVTAVSPVVGTINGGTTVTVTGTGFLTATGVKFGATAGTGVTILSDTSLTVVSPAHAAGQIDITVTNTTAASTPVAADKYTYDGIPTVTAVSLVVGTINGGTTVTVTGTGFLTATGVKFGATAGTGVTILSDTSLTVVSPAHAAGQIDITVTNPAGTSTPNAADHYTYQGLPTVTAVNPTAGLPAGGTSVTITGTGFLTATAVKFGAGLAASFVVNSDTSITAITAAGAGTVDVQVTNSTGTSALNPPADQFTFEGNPTVTGVAPAAGTTAGTTTVVITGTNFTGATLVSIGGIPATGVVINSATQITAVTPAHAAGQVDVTVTTPVNTSVTGPQDKYTYDGVPTVTAVTPAAGTTLGNASVTVTGTGFLTATAVKFGATAATIVTINSDTSITVTTPAEAAGQIDVTVTNPAGTSTPVAADHYTYQGMPTVTSLNPTAGTTGGGSTVVISGTNFTAATQVLFGGTAATTFAVNSATQITATSPAGAAGPVDVKVTTPVGTSGVVAADQFTYIAPPTVVITFPVLGAYTGAAWDTAGAGCDVAGSTICGTASSGASTVSSVGVSIRQGGGNYWNGSSFSSAVPVYNLATGTTAWSLIFPSGDFTAGTYTIVAQATDAVGGSSTASKTVTITAPGAPGGRDIQGMPQGPPDATPDNGDSVVYTYNQVMSSTSILGGWNGTATGVNARFTTAGGQTVLTIQTTNLGTAALGDQAGRYIGANRTLTATMTMATVNGRSVVTVTFTSSSGGIVPGPANTTLIWTPSAAATNPAGTASSATPVTESASPKQNF